MRRFVDSLLFLLIVYTLSWPFVRPLVGASNASVRLALDGQPIAAAEIIVEHGSERFVVRTDESGEACLPQRVDAAHCSVQLPGWYGPVKAVSGDALEPVLPDGVVVFTGRSGAARLVARLCDCEGPRSVAFDCAAGGLFSFAMERPACEAPVLALETADGERLQQVAVPTGGAIVVLGDVGGR